MQSSIRSNHVLAFIGCLSILAIAIACGDDDGSGGGGSDVDPGDAFDACADVCEYILDCFEGVGGFNPRFEEECDAVCDLVADEVDDLPQDCAESFVDAADCLTNVTCGEFGEGSDDCGFDELEEACKDVEFPLDG
jgi:hypothetical protein